MSIEQIGIERGICKKCEYFNGHDGCCDRGRKPCRLREIAKRHLRKFMDSIEICPICLGSGTDKNSKAGMCIACNGNGYYEI